ncbi:MAG: hypothetical protein JWQ29_875 [Phenylobacterium sp.]|nr:hypothetical protein [Phenylobacterium sp.]
MKTKTALAAFAAALFALCATASAPALAKSPTQPGKRQCFFASLANGFAAPDERTLYVRVGVRDVYEFQMFGSCPNLDWSQRLALVSHTSSICTGMDADVVTRGPIGPERCPVRSVRKLTPEEVAALPPKARP